MLCWILIFLLTALNSFLLSQTEEENKIQFTGNASITQEVYQFEASDSTLQARRLPNQTRFTFNSSLDYGMLQVPITLVLSTRQSNYLTAKAPTQSFMQYLQNPLNYISIAPKYEWAQFQIGSQAPQFSDLTMGNRQIFGIGMDLLPNDFRIASFYGISQRGIEPLGNQLQGTYTQYIYGAKFQYGKEKTGSIGLNFAAFYDDTNSIQNIPSAISIYPEEGLISSINFSIPFTEKIYLYSEVAASAFTRNQFSDKVVFNGIEVDLYIQEAKSSTLIDGAAKSRLVIDYGNWGLNAQGIYVSDGFRSVGYQFFVSDRVEYTIGGNYRTEDSKFNVNGSIGQRFNNLQETKSTTTNQIIANCNIFYQLTDDFSANISYTNFGIRNNTLNDTLKLEMVSNSFSFTPSYRFETDWTNNNLNLVIAADDFEDFNTLTGEFRTNSTKNASLVFVSALKDIPFSGNLFTTYVTNNLPNANLELISIGFGGNYRLLDNTFVPGLRLSLNQSSIGSNTDDIKIGVRFTSRYKLENDLILRLNYSLNDYSYGSSRSNATFTENYLQFGLSYSF
ncbi:MAG: hypothetical protein R2863_03695 [Candidatus Kapaibacterium sp.]